VAALAAAVLLFGGAFDSRGPEPLPSDARAAVLRGYEQLERARIDVDPARYPAAEREFRQALEIGGVDALAYRGLAALAAARHRFDESLELAHRARMLDPTDHAIYGLIGDANLELGRYPKAIAAIDRMVALKPTSGGYARVSYARELLGEDAGAVAAMRLAANAAGRPEPTAWALVHVGHLFAGRGRLRAAEREYRAALRFVADYAPALAGLGDLSAARNQLERAEMLYRRSFGAVPDPGVAASLGDVLASRGDSSGAERWFRRSRSLEREFARFGGRNQIETAEFDLNHDRNLRDALARARMGARLRPGIEGTHILAWGLYKNGRCREAVGPSNRALRLAPNDVDAVYHRSLIESCLGNAKAAARYRARVRALDPYYLVAPPSSYRLPTIAAWRSERTSSIG
jgi:tetratricopeptide (TPR) repeat protein